MYRHAPTMQELRRALIGDSVERTRLLAKYVVLIRADERAKMEALDETIRRARDRAESEGSR